MEQRSWKCTGTVLALAVLQGLALVSAACAQQAVNDVTAMAAIGPGGANEQGLLVCPSEVRESVGQSGSAVIDGPAGGRLAVGRFLLDVPAGAFVGRATFLIAVPDAGVLECRLDTVPRLGRFEIPLRLTVDCAAADPVLMERSNVLSFDERARVWKKAGGSSVDPSSGMASAQLAHVSAFAVGLRHGFQPR
jgi:hypothetical protein